MSALPGEVYLTELQSCPASQYNVSSKNASHVPAGLYLASKAVAATTGLWKAVGNLETRILGEQLGQHSIVKPVFISGVARSGSTILTEIISRHPQFACHHYSDFPMTWVPYWWNSLRKQLPLPKPEPRERAHRDRLMITADSPEAIEEVLWMHFFPGAHKADGCHVLSGQERHPPFEKYYRDHIQKLLAVRHRQRYVAKNNYHVTRLEYLLQLFPDARFIIPIRSPEQQVASLVKQHRLFSGQDAEDPRVSRQLQRSGHYEFGPLRCPIIVSDDQRPHYSRDLDDVAWYAAQWADVYGFLHARMKDNQALAEACLVVRYEDTCSQAVKRLQRIFAHLDLDDAAGTQIISDCAPAISAPDYYQPDFTAAEVQLIRKITGDTDALFARRDT